MQFCAVLVIMTVIILINRRMPVSISVSILLDWATFSKIYLFKYMISINFVRLI